MNESGIIIENLSKSYGKKKALRNLNLNISPGMFGLLGKNGAGKTTLMKTIATLLRKQEGRITVCGVSVERAAEIRAIIGYLPQDFNMYGGMTAVQALDYLGVLSGLSKTERKSRIPVILERVNLERQAGKKVKALSGGMRQRLGIAQALLHDPKVLIVDEPTAGLDPEERVRFRNLLSQIAEDKTVILSTHIVGDVEATCENIAILDEGALLFGGTVSRLCELAEGNVYIAEVKQDELNKIRAAYTVTAIVSQRGRHTVRFLSAQSRPAFGDESSPTAEDAYIYCLQTKGGRC